MEQNKEVLLKVDHLEQYFKMGKGYLKAVDDVSFEIYKGEVFGLVGESGCGKTTTGRSIIRLYDITGGSVYFDDVRIAAGVNEYKKNIKAAKEELKALKKKTIEDVNVNNDPENKTISDESETREEELYKIIEENTLEMRRAKYDHKNCDKEFAKAEVEKVKNEYEEKIANESDEAKKAELIEEEKKAIKYAKKARITTNIQMIFQDPIASLDPRMTVHDIIAEGLIIRGEKDKKKIDEEVYRVLELVGLVREHASRYPHEFSGGQRQRIGIARAIILNPKLIIADEPVSALDVSIQAQVINLLNELRDKMGLTTLFIAHDLSVVKYFSDRIAVMYFGKIVELTTSDELFAHPLHPYTKSLLSAIPLPDPHFEKQRKRVTYNPLIAHDYSKEQPSLREIVPGHFVYCNSEEEAKYKEEITK